MTKISDLHKKWMKDPAYRKEYEGMEGEFALMAAVAKARTRSGLSQAELAKRMKTTQSTIARLESGRGMPSTRTLGSHDTLDVCSRVHAMEDPLAVLGHFVLNFHQ